MPSLYLKKDYNSNLGSIQLSRNQSVERGVASIHKNNFLESTNKLSPNPDRPPSTSTHRLSRPNLKTSTQRNRELNKVEEARVSLNSSVEKLKQTFCIPPQPIPVIVTKEKEKQAGGGNSSTRYTSENEITITWRDDLNADIEKEITFTSCLGQGSFAKVYEGFDKRLKQTVAIKVIDKRKITEPKRRALIQTEINLLARMKHKNITEFFRLFEDNKRVFIVMQLCGSLTLNVFCRQFPEKRLNEEQAYALFSQIAKGVKYMHDHNVAHRDLKLTNILIDNEYTVKIIDFGFACEANERHRMYCGTPSYMAPEIVEKKLYQPKPTDIWSLGVVLFKLLSGEYAFGGKPG
jgi:MAP/microtubule affinity-regulating kinase